MTSAAPEVSTQLVSLGVLRASTPEKLVESATAMADALHAVIEKKELYSLIRGKRHVKVEGWTTCLAMLGVMPHEVNVVEHDGIFVATVELRTLRGEVVGRASAECGAPDETDREGKQVWSTRSRQARRSMALTRATAKAARLAFSWIIALAGFEATPAEELAHDEHTGEVLKKAPKEARNRVAHVLKEAGVTRKAFGEFYENAVGRPFVNIYEQDVDVLLEAAKSLGPKEPAAAPAAAPVDPGTAQEPAEATPLTEPAAKPEPTTTHHEPSGICGTAGEHLREQCGYYAPRKVAT